MWRNTYPLTSVQLKNFETAFAFNITLVFRDFLMEHNGGVPTPGTFPTSGSNRRIQRFLNFYENISPSGAWAINRRLREKIGPKRIIFGVDSLGNFLCLERSYKRQFVVLWNHLTGEFEPCLWDIPAFLRGIG